MVSNFSNTSASFDTSSNTGNGRSSLNVLADEVGKGVGGVAGVSPAVGDTVDDTTAAEGCRATGSV